MPAEYQFGSNRSWLDVVTSRLLKSRGFSPQHRVCIFDELILEGFRREPVY